MKAPWSPDEDRVLRWAMRRGFGPAQLCKPLERSYSAVRSRWRRLGLRARQVSQCVNSPAVVENRR